MTAITDLSTASSAGDSDYLVISQSGIDKKMTRTVLGLTGAGTIATGGFTLTVPATGTAALRATSNTFTASQILSGASVRFEIDDGAGASKKALIIEGMGYGGNNYARLQAYDYGGSTNGEIRLNGDGGNVKIGVLTGSGNRAVYSDPNGYLTNSSSDERLKTNTEPIISSDALAIVNALSPVRYNWLDTETRGAQREIGLIAQQIAPHVPEVIGENNDGMLSVDYPKLVAVLIGAVQELTARISALESAQAK